MEIDKNKHLIFMGFCCLVMIKMDRPNIRFWIENASITSNVNTQLKVNKLPVRSAFYKNEINLHPQSGKKKMLYDLLNKC
jgi:hypothetical protein